jgi:nucleotide-binding universal stress UspA family protein
MTAGGDQRIQRIVVPLEGSTFSENALPTAFRLAKHLDADVFLFSAVDTVDDKPDRLRRLRSIELPDQPVAFEVVVDRDPAGAIHEMLRRLPASVACMATHARVRSAAVARSVLTELLVRAHDPVIAVGPLIGDVAPWLEHEPARGVVVGVDDNGEAQHLLEEAADWSVQLHEPLTVLTVAEPVPPPLAAGPVRRRYGPDGDVDLFLRVLLARLHRDDVEIEPRVLYDPIGPVDGIVAWVREHPSILLVVGTTAPSGLERLAKGSTAAAVVRRSAAPVLVVPTRVRRGQTGDRTATRAAKEPAR